MNFVAILFLSVVTIIFLLGIFRTFRMSKISVGLIEKYENDKKNPALIDDIFSEINKDFFLARVFKRNFGEKKDIELLHKKLMKWGDFRKYNRYVPITSFFNVNTLDYLLKHKNDDAQKLTEKVMNHFHI
ncbi:MAG: hypothetical protein IK062_04180 [Selenomonadaceae bacterium]|nr:hypothetical protein [Selenomonadaceae bacterium]